MRKLAAWLIALVGLLAFWAVLVADGRFSTPKPRLATRNFWDIRKGMSQAEVEKLLGGPPGDYGRNVGGTSFVTAEGFCRPPGSIERLRYDDSNQFEIYFDAEERVVAFRKRAAPAAKGSR
jgi:hypothetical protein